jgi:transcription initiation factor TFIIB
MPNAPQDYVDYFCNQLNLSQQAKTKALDILRQADDRGMTSGRGPTSVAAAAVYIAAILCDEHRTQQQVAQVAGVTEVTIRNRYKELPESKEAEGLLQML